MIDFATVAWFVQIAFATIANAIPLETIGYAAAMVAAVYLSHKETRECRHRIEALEQNIVQLATYTSAVRQGMETIANTVEQRLQMQDKVIEARFSNITVRAEVVLPTEECDSEDDGSEQCAGCASPSCTTKT